VLKKFSSFVLTVFLLFSFNNINVFAISARSAVVMDIASGRILYSHNKDEKRGMASTTKIMTAICAIEHGNPEKVVTVSPTASGVEGSSMYLSQGERLTLSDLVYGLMLVSGNDAATAIAETVSGSVEKFAVLMNDKAAEIGAFNTSFTNPHGLSDDNHYTTAHDLAKITAYAMQNPTFCEIVSTKSKKMPANEDGYARHLVNHNKLLNLYDGCIGVKTGFTKATGRCLVSAAERSGLRLVCVTLNDPDDWRDHTDLLNSAFATYSPYTIKSATETAATTAVRGGVSETIDLVYKNDIIIPVKQGEESSVKLQVQPFEDLAAPINQGDIIGTVTASIGDELCGEFPLIAKSTVEEKKVLFKAPQNGFAENLKKVFYAWLTCFN